MNTQIHSGPGTPTSEIGEPNSQVVVADRSTSDRALLRFAAVAIPIGIVLQILMETLHPSKADPNDSAAAFQEYAALEYLDHRPHRPILRRTAGRPRTGRHSPDH